jgi:regulator of protease activity HflC (stomatin/prohibitin superfamily)
MYLLILVAIFILVGTLGIRIVRQQQILIVETMGRFTKTLHPGFNWIFCPFSQVAGTVSLMVNSIESSVEIKTKDNMFVTLPINLMYQVKEEKASNAFYKLHNPSAQINAWVLNVIRSTAAQMDFEELFEDRTKITKEVEQDLAVRLEEYGYQIISTLIDQPSVPENIQATFNGVIAATREQEAAVQQAKANRIKIEAVAAAEAEAQRLRAQGVADSRLILAKGFKDAAAEFDGISLEGSLDFLLSVNRMDMLRDIGAKGNLILDLGKESNVQLQIPTRTSTK